MKNKIGWCDMTWNPVWGCLNNCPYCYAMRMANRFAGKLAEKEVDEIYGGSIDGNSLIAFYNEKKRDIKNFYPTLLHSQFNKKLPKKPQRIFVGSMSEIYYWEPEWIERVIEKVKEYPWHTFQFLTKFPQVYFDWVWPENCWLGVTVTEQVNFYNGQVRNFLGDNANLEYRNVRYISFEPLLKEMLNLELLSNVDWVIIGAETGNREGKIKPKRSWIENILYYCRRNKIPVYIKDNLSKHYDEYRGYKQFPEKRGGKSSVKAK